jgi:UDP-2-acetamido-3-amino-2,3-dideoxy-glucuronate N-acetyltransferase
MKIGVIGTGYWGPNIVRNLLALGQDVTIYDIDESHLRNTCEKHQNCRRAGSLDEILHNAAIPAVAISVPLKSHSDLVIKSLKAGKNVFVEKSLCYSSREADKILVHLNGTILMVGHITLFTPGIARIKELITNNCIGKLTWISLTRTHLGKVYPEVDVASEVSSHDISILLFLIRELPLSVNAWGSSRLGLNTADNATIIIRYKDNLTCAINVQWTSVIRERKILIEGTSGTIVSTTDNVKEELILFDQQEAFEALRKGANPKESMLKVKSQVLMQNQQEPLYDELAVFLNCIQYNKQPLTNIEFGIRVVKVFEAIRKSMQLNGKTIKISW